MSRLAAGRARLHHVGMRTHVAVLMGLIAAGCSSTVGSESTPLALNPCGSPVFEPGQCVDEVLNDGTGPEDRRRVCAIGGDTWILYPSGEQWHIRPRDGGDPVLCHAAADGALLWQSDAG